MHLLQTPPAYDARARRFGRRRHWLALCVGLSIGWLPRAQAQPVQQPPAASETAAEPTSAALPALASDVALRASQAVIGKAIGDYTLLDREGRPVRLSSYRGKPLLVSFIYTGCFQICPISTRALHEAVQALQKSVGTGMFNVVSVGFNQPMDSPQALRAFALQHRIDAPNWEFLSPHASIVEPLTRDFGFSFVATPAGFDHVLAATVVDAQGRIYTQVYGERLAANTLGEPLRQLLRGAPMPQSLRLVDVIDRVRILCTVYDPATGQYRYKYDLIIEIAGGVTFALAMLWFFAAEWRARRRLRRAARGVEQAAAMPR